MTSLAELLAQRAASGQALAQVPPPASLAPSNPFTGPQSRPSYWMPGDPMNEDQAYFQAKGKPLSYIANLAENPPPPDVSAAYDKPALPPVEPRPPVEAGQFNPPESAGMVPFANEEEIEAAFPPAVLPGTEESGDFAALKAECERLGLNPEGKKLRTSGYQKLLNEHKARGQSPVTVLATPQSTIGSAFMPAPTSLFVPPSVQTATANVPVIASVAQPEEFADLVADRVLARMAALFAREAR